MNNGATVSESAQRFRDTVNTSHIRDRLTKDKKKWNRLCACMDVLKDTEMAIAAFPGCSADADTGEVYLRIYGLLQAMFVQQDAVCHACSAIGMDYQRPEQVENGIRRVRNKAIGHPAEKSYGIVQASMSPQEFEIYRFDGAEGWKPERVEIRTLVKMQAQEVTSALTRMINHLLNLS